MANRPDRQPEYSNSGFAHLRTSFETSTKALLKKQCKLSLRYLCHRKETLTAPETANSGKFPRSCMARYMFKGVAKLKSNGLEIKSRLESKRPRVVRRLDPTVWWLAGVNLEKRPLRSGTGLASSGPREYENTKRCIDSTE